MGGKLENLVDAFVQEHWQEIPWGLQKSIEAYKDQCRQYRNSLATAMFYDIANGASAMDQIYPFTEMPEVSGDFVGDQSASEAKSRCCKAPVFRDGDYLICNQCRLVTKLVETQGD